MTGAGSGSLAFGKTDSFLGTLVDADTDGTPEYFEPGQDPTIQDLTLERALARQREPGNVWSADSIPENLEGAFGIQYTMDETRQADVHDIVFNATAPVTLEPGLAATSRWFVGLDYLSGTAERVLLGCAPLDYSVEYTQGGAIRVTITFVYADEELNTSITPGTLQEANGAPAQFHGFNLDVGGTTQVKEQSATLSISNISRLQRGSEPVAVDAVVGAAEASLELTAIVSETDQLELAYGGANQTSTSKTMDSVAATMTCSAAGAPIAEYQLAKVTPTTYGGWTELIGEEDVTEQITFNVDGDPAVTVA